MADGGVLLAEAPTGLGKSIAYLVPSLLEAARSHARIVVATATRGLQDQLFERDLPAVARALGVTVSCVRLKGKQNYLCPHALERAGADGEEEQQALDALRRWAVSDDEGDLDRFPAPDPEAFRRVRAGVATDPDACTMLSCRRGAECFWVRARRLAGEARVLVVNHALLARAASAEGILPEFDVLVVDEAHRLEDVLLSQLERSVARHRFDELLRVLGTSRGRRRDAGLLGKLAAFTRLRYDDGARADTEAEALEALTDRLAEVRSAVDRLFSRLELPAAGAEPYGRRQRHRSAAELLGADIGLLETVYGHCGHFARVLHRHAEALSRPDASRAALDLSGELEQVAGRWSQLGQDLLDVCEAGDRDWVYWRAASGHGVRVHGVPVAAGEFARRLVAGRARAAILMSATLTAGGDFGFTAERLGLGEEHGAPYATSIEPSPFDLPRQMRAFVLDRADGEAAVVSDVVARLAERTGRSQLVLFTAHDRLKRARALLMQRLGRDTPLFAQEWDGSMSRLTERFRLTRGSILLGVQSLWEGVDFPGEELEIVVVAKLPFSVPDDPRVEARGERLRDRGEDPFRADAVPEAVLRFRQGIGRLIRRAGDRGVLVVCDPRLTTASYRRPFVAALPTAPRRCADAAEIADEAARFFAAPLEEVHA